MLKYLLKKSRFDFTETYTCTDEDLEMENSNEDAGLDACRSNVDEGAKFISDIVEMVGSDDSDLEGEEFVFDEGRSKSAVTEEGLFDNI